ncbi:hypothetical protein KR026_008825 [Drosophila bipectinata]|nr:hypothetical protein KR026_008825 [Drosophila bipectinata]
MLHSFQTRYRKMFLSWLWLLTVVGVVSLVKGTFVEIGGRNYYIETRVEKNWFEAFQGCRLLNADLVYFESFAEWRLVDEYLWDNNLDNVYWTSGTDLGHQGYHVWFSTGKPIVLDIWKPAEPNNDEGIERCDEMGWRRNVTNSHRLNDKNCDSNRRFICKAR